MPSSRTRLSLPLSFLKASLSLIATGPTRAFSPSKRAS